MGNTLINKNCANRDSVCSRLHWFFALMAQGSNDQWTSIYQVFTYRASSNEEPASSIEKRGTSIQYRSNVYLLNYIESNQFQPINEVN